MIDFNSKSVIQRIVVALSVVCALLFILDFVYHKHVHFDFENFPGAYALIGFASYVSLVISAKSLRKVIKRPEDYYESEVSDDAR